MLILALVVSLVAIFLELVSGHKAALILARGGSKGIPLKNLRTVGGVTLLGRSIRTAKAAGLEDVTVSTDHPLIALEALKNGARVFQRSRVTATDWAPSIWGAKEFVSKRQEVTILVLLQATSPFLKPTLLQKALRNLDYPRSYDCVFSAVRSYKLRWRLKNGLISPINFNTEARPRRQDWDGELIETGSFYVSRRHLIERGHFQNLK